MRPSVLPCVMPDDLAAPGQAEQPRVQVRPVHLRDRVRQLVPSLASDCLGTAVPGDHNREHCGKRDDERRDVRATNGRRHRNAHLDANLCPHQGRAHDGKDEKDERKAVPVVRRAGERRIEVRQPAKLRRDQYGCRRRPRRDQRRGDQLKSPHVDGNRGDEPDCQRDPRTTAVREIDGRCEDDERG